MFKRVQQWAGCPENSPKPMSKSSEWIELCGPELLVSVQTSPIPLKLFCTNSASFGVINTQEEEGWEQGEEPCPMKGGSVCLTVNVCFWLKDSLQCWWNAFLDPLKKCIDPYPKWNFVFQWRQNGDCTVSCRCKTYRVMWLLSVHKPFVFSKIFSDLRPSPSTWFFYCVKY